MESDFKIFKQLNEYNRHSKKADVEKLKKTNDEKVKEMELLKERVALMKAIAEKRGRDASTSQQIVL